MIKFWKFGKIKELRETEKEICELLKAQEIIEISQASLRSMPLTYTYIVDKRSTLDNGIIFEKLLETDYYKFADEWIKYMLKTLYECRIQPRMNKADELRRELNIR